MASAYEVSFLDAIKIRRSILSVTNESPISDRRITMIVKHAIKHSPSPFDVYSSRAIVLFGKEHVKLWNIALETCSKTLPPPMWAAFEPRLKDFRAGYGTVLFFDNPEAISNIPERLQGLMKGNPEWYDHANGMAQFIVWTALAVEGLGCSLQHLGPHLVKGVQDTWNVPKTWELKAQLVFGKATGPPRGGVEKTFPPVDDRCFSYGAGSAA